jgi:hypothetical protein
MTENLRDLLAREAVEAEARADAEERGSVSSPRGQRGRKRSEDPSQVYAVRIPVSRLNEIRSLADRYGEAPSALIRQWVIERLDDLKSEDSERSAGSTTVRRLGADSIPAGEVRLGPRRQMGSFDPAVRVRRRRRHA